MTQFRLELGRQEDDSDLRRILRENSMGRSISLTLRKEPSFFDALSVEGEFNQVVVARNTESKKVVGFGARSIKPAFVNGEDKNIGYLGCLRLDHEFRGTTLVPRGYKLFSELHQDEKTPFYLTTIVEDNKYAKQILTSNRMGMPNYHDYGLYYTYAVPIPRKRDEHSSKIIQAEESHIGDIIKFLNAEGRRKQFYPRYKPEDLQNNSGLLRGLKIGDISLHFDNSEIDGVMAGWNQHSFKQTVIERYNGLMKYSRPAINLLNKIQGYLPFLPQEGESLNYSSGALIAVRDNNPEVFNDLIKAQINNLTAEEIPLLMIGLHSQDPLAEVAKKHSKIRFPTRAYVVTWANGEKDYQSLDGRIPYLELGSL